MAPLTTIPGAIPWPIKGEYARGYDVTESPYPLDVINRASKWMLLASGYNPDVNPFYLDRTYTLDANHRSEVNLGLRIQAIHDALPSSGGIIDCRGLVGAQLLSASINITKPSVTILLGSYTLTFGDFQLLVSPTASNFQLIGIAAYSYGTFVGGSGGTVIYKSTGSLAAIVIGDGTAIHYCSRVENLCVHIGDSNDNANVIGIWLKRAFYSFTQAVFIAAGGVKYNQTCFRVDGAGGVCANNIIVGCVFDHGGKGVHITGAAANVPAGVSFSGCFCIGTVGGYKGVVIDAASNGCSFVGGEITGCLVGIDLSGGAFNNYFNTRFPVGTNVTDAVIAAACPDNWIHGFGLNTITDTDGTTTVIKQGGTSIGSRIKFGQDPIIFKVGADRGDTAQTLTVKTDARIQRWATALTVNRIITLSTAGAANGDTFRVVRTGLGAFNLDVGGLKTIVGAVAAYVDVAYNGTIWVLTGYGLL